MNNKEIFSKNLQYYISKKGINQTEFAEDLDYPATTVSNWINAKTYPRIDKIQEMANYFGINKSDLQEEKELKERVVINVNQVPLVGRIAAGTPILAEENIEDHFNLDSSNAFFESKCCYRSLFSITNTSFPRSRRRRNVYNWRKRR